MLAALSCTWLLGTFPGGACSLPWGGSTGEHGGDEASQAEGQFLSWAGVCAEPGFVLIHCGVVF